MAFVNTEKELHRDPVEAFGMLSRQAQANLLASVPEELALENCPTWLWTLDDLAAYLRAEENFVAETHEPLLSEEARVAEYSRLQQRIFERLVRCRAIGETPETKMFRMVAEIEKQRAAAITQKNLPTQGETIRRPQVQLPLWPEKMRGVPNGILRSALFGAIKRGKRRYVEREPMAAVGGVSLIYTGPRLDQADLDVWEGALHIARDKPLGGRVEFSEKGFLKLIGRGGEGGESIGKSDREWLKKTLARLKANAVEFKQERFAYGGSLIDEYFRDEENGRYVLILNPRLEAMFKHDGWTAVDWGIRRILRGYPLAQWLHGFYSSHAKPYPLKVETLHKLCGSESGGDAKTDAERAKALAGWREDSLVPALNALVTACEQAGQTFSWELKNELLDVNRDATQAQKKHLRKEAAKRSAVKKVGG